MCVPHRLTADFLRDDYCLGGGRRGGRPCVCSQQPLDLLARLRFPLRSCPLALFLTQAPHGLRSTLQVYVNTATAAIANVACNYSAYTFFNDKQGIAIAMQRYLNSQFTSKLFAQIEALQINQVELPSSFQDAILESISTKQNITRSQRYKENMQVTFSTQTMVAQQSANQTVIRAGGYASQKLQRARANARMTQQTVQAEMASYGNLSQKIRFSSADTLNYLWWDTLQSAAQLPDAQKKEFLIGLDPAAYIKGGASR
jgi:hypothetical protein